MSQPPETNAPNRAPGTKAMCPFIGAVEDPETRFAYPSSGNFCHRVDPVEPVSYGHQELFCLTPAFVKCPVYQENWEGALPKDIRADMRDDSARRARPAIFFLVLVLILASVLVGGWYLQSQGLLFASNRASETPIMVTETQSDLPFYSATPSPTAEIIDTPTPTATLPPTDTAVPSATPTATFTPTPSKTPPPTPGPGLGTPFGVDAAYVIHRVADGESLSALARLYNTTEEVIKAANATVLERRTAWPGDQLAIPIGEQDPENVVEFQVLFLGKKTTVEDLADQCAVTVDEIQTYNDLGTDPWIPAGRWLIVPGNCE